MRARISAKNEQRKTNRSAAARLTWEPLDALLTEKINFASFLARRFFKANLLISDLQRMLPRRNLQFAGAENERAI